ncbi:isochorismatase family protein [Parasaccharibacter sp. TMW 2.1888]|uniref:isochorismatase family protein n=1 Tax=Parasaccharibacter sp. TMW 2.1888 TaxID=2268025 RepID=UPI00204F632C|nr:isochorismatase family protein [Parasaccharibacter sp. TMW 2.1888]UPO79167.1 isochorismatase family protein [Parasaccharibacter sp. TMW 2.1888]
MNSHILLPHGISAQDALLIIDMQNDFMPGGALPVPGGHDLLHAINGLSHLNFRAVVASQDWHPMGHCSFKEQNGPWPAHCIAGTDGAAMVEGLDQRRITHIIRKGTATDADSNSAFRDDSGRSTGLTDLLNGLGVTRVFLCGVALDVCVLASARHAVRAGFETFIIQQASAGIRPPSASSLLEESIKLV